MKKTTRTAVAVILATAPVLTMAAGTIKFTGEVKDQTCTVNVEGEGSHTVPLPTVSTGQLDGAGATAGVTPFKLSVTGCKVASADVAINTVFSGVALTNNENLKNLIDVAKGGAENVEIQLLTGVGGLPIQLQSVTTVPGLVVLAGEQMAEYEFAAQYFASGTATPGSVEATVNYDITYN